MSDQLILNPWFVCPAPNRSARLRLFCFPYAGGAPSIFQNWPRGLPPTVELWALQLAGRGARLMEPAATALPDLVRDVEHALVPLLDKPFALFGYSMGALIGFEVVRALHRDGFPAPEHLFVAACGAPHLPNPSRPLYHLPDHEFLEGLRRLKGTPREVLENAELMELLLPALRADFTICDTYAYAPGPPLDCSVTVLGGLEDREVSSDRLKGWRDLTTGNFSLTILPGDHFFLHSARQALLRALGSELYELVASPRGSR